MTNQSGGSQFLDPQKIINEVGIKAGQQLGELGCGAVGYFVFPLAKQVGKEGHVYAVDIRRLVLEGIKNRARIDGMENIETIWSNLEVFKGTGIPDNTLDVALLITVLFQNQKKEDILIEAIRMIKPGGYLAVVDWQKKKESFIGPAMEVRVEPQKVVEFCQSKGLTVAEEFIPSNFHFGLLFKKVK